MGLSKDAPSLMPEITQANRKAKLAGADEGQ